MSGLSVDADCKMTWFRDKHFSVSAKGGSEKTCEAL